MLLVDIYGARKMFAYIFHVMFSHLVMKFKKNSGEGWPRGGWMPTFYQYLNKCSE